MSTCPKVSSTRENAAATAASSEASHSSTSARRPCPATPAEESLERLAVDVDQGDVGAERRQARADRRAEPAAGPGDDRDPVGQVEGPVQGRALSPSARALTRLGTGSPLR